MANERASEFKLKRPTVVHLLAIGFMLAPFANLTVPRMLRGQKSWYFPTQWFLLFTRLPFLEQFLFVSTIAGGILLFFQRKWSWFAAVIILTVVSGYNIWFHLGVVEKTTLNNLYMVVNASILIVFFYFRFPYLDQRDHVFSGYAKRVAVNIETQINGTQKASIRNISDTGCFLDLGNEGPKFTLGQQIELHFTKPMGQILSASVEHVRNSGVGVKFTDLDVDRKKFVQALKKTSA